MSFWHRPRSRTASFTGPDFNPYKLTGVTVTDRELGRGSYATVLELDYMGLKCAGKKIHKALVDAESDAGLNSGDSYVVLRFEEECGILSKIRHPNIVQFLGVFFENRERIPILVMEFLPTNLTTCIMQCGVVFEGNKQQLIEVLPKQISYSILHDVALGLCYLHSQTPPIIHRDLSSNNVLLTANMTAKISDLGVARILNLTPLHVKISRMTQTPGTPAYMPPEVMIANPKYDTSVDVFSYGIMMIHMFSGRWPEPQEGQIRTEPGKLIPITEAERRTEYLQIIGKDHPMMDLIQQCIRNHPPERPCAAKIVRCLSEKVKAYPDPFTDRLQMLRLIEGQREEKKQLLKSLRDKEELEKEIVEMKMLQSAQVEQLRVEIEREKAVNQFFDSEATLDQNKVLEKVDKKLLILNDQVEGVIKYLGSNKALQACLKCKRGQDLAVAICRGQSVIMNNKVYFGGGEAENEQDCFIIQSYDPLQDLWTSLPPLPVRFFGLGQINGHLVAVGGECKSNKSLRNKELQMLEGKVWNSDAIPPMVEARVYPTVISYRSMLLIAGGEYYDRITKAVEIFEMKEKQWIKAGLNYLPAPCCGLSVVFADTERKHYVLGGWNDDGNLNHVMYISDDDLSFDHDDIPVLEKVPAAADKVDLELSLRSPTHLKEQQSIRTPWKQLPHTPICAPAAASLAGSLIALGGSETPERRCNPQSKIFKYSSKLNSWIYIGDLPSPLSETTAVVLSSTEVLVIGGWDGQRISKAVYRLTMMLE